MGAITRVTEAMEQVLSLVEKARSFHSHKTLATDVAKTDTRKQDCKALDAVCRGCGKRDTLRMSVSRLNISHIHLRFHKLPPVLQGQGPVTPLLWWWWTTHIYTHGQCSSCKQTVNQVSHSIGLYNTEELDRKFHHTSSDCVAQGRHRGWCQLDEQTNISPALW